MAYQVCMRALVVRHQHNRDNSVEGTINVQGQQITYKSRGHIAKAVNRIYRNVSWKPAEGEEVIIDGDLNGKHIIVDHIEPWRPREFVIIDRYKDFQAKLLERLKIIPEMGPILRQSLHDDEGTQVRYVRWAKPVKAREGRKTLPAIITAIEAEGDMRFALRSQVTGKILPQQDVAILPLIANTLGIPFVFEPDAVPLGRSSDPNKWRPGVPYRPIGMPQDSPVLMTDEVPFDTGEPVEDADCPF